MSQVGKHEVRQEFDPEKVERVQCYAPFKDVQGFDTVVVDAEDYDKLLALYRAQPSSALPSQDGDLGNQGTAAELANEFAIPGETFDQWWERYTFGLGDTRPDKESHRNAWICSRISAAPPEHPKGPDTGGKQK